MIPIELLARALQHQLSAFLLSKDLVDVPCHLAPSFSTFTDFLPFLRELVRFEKRQRVEEEGIALRRATRNSGGTGIPRRVVWNKKEAERLEKSGFPEVEVVIGVNEVKEQKEGEGMDED